MTSLEVSRVDISIMKCSGMSWKQSAFSRKLTAWMRYGMLSSGHLVPYIFMGFWWHESRGHDNFILPQETGFQGCWTASNLLSQESLLPSVFISWPPTPTLYLPVIRASSLKSGTSPMEIVRPNFWPLVLPGYGLWNQTQKVLRLKRSLWTFCL